MVKIMLVIDDYKESLACHTLLKKLGFDVMLINKESQFQQTVLGFLPEIVIASFKTKNVDGLALGMRAKKLISKPRVLLLYTSDVEPALSAEQKLAFDHLLSSPFEFEQLLSRTAEMARMDVQALLDKYSKMRNRRSPENNFASGLGAKDITHVEAHVGGDSHHGLGADLSLGAQSAKSKINSSMSSEVRMNRYQAFLDKVKNEPVGNVIDRKALNQRVAQLEADSKGEENLIEAINAQKLEFAKALFNK